MHIKSVLVAPTLFLPLKCNQGSHVFCLLTVSLPYFNFIFIFSPSQEWFFFFWWTQASYHCQMLFMLDVSAFLLIVRCGLNPIGLRLWFSHGTGWEGQLRHIPMADDVWPHGWDGDYHLWQRHSFLWTVSHPWDRLSDVVSSPSLHPAMISAQFADLPFLHCPAGTFP